MATIHITEAEATRDFSSVLAQVRAGAEVIIESDNQSAAVLRTVSPQHRTLSDSIALAESHERELGYAPRMDAAFAADMEEIIQSRRPRRSTWD